MAIKDMNGVELAVNDWLSNSLTGGLYQVEELGTDYARLLKIDDVWNPDLTNLVDTKGEEITCHYEVNPATETLDEVIADFATYDYNKKFYRVAYVAFARRVIRAWNSDVTSITARLTDAIPTQLSQLMGDTTHRTVTDAQIAEWNAK